MQAPPAAPTPRRLFPDVPSPSPAAQRKIAAQISRCKDWRRLAERVLPRYLLLLDSFTAGVLFRRLPTLQPLGARAAVGDAQLAEFRTMVRATCAALQPRLASFAPATLLDVAHGLQRMALREERFLSAWCAAAAPHMPGLRPAQLARAAAALGDLDYAPAGDWTDALLAAAAAQLPGFSASELAALLRGAALLRLRPPEAFLATACEALRAAATAPPAAPAAAMPRGAARAPAAADAAAKAQQKQREREAQLHASVACAAASLAALSYAPGADWSRWYLAWLQPALLAPDGLADALQGAVTLGAPLPDAWLRRFGAVLDASIGAASTEGGGGAAPRAAAALARCFATLRASRVQPPPELAAGLQRLSETLLPATAPAAQVATAEAVAAWLPVCPASRAWLAAYSLAAGPALAACDDSTLLRALRVAGRLPLPRSPLWLLGAVRACAQRLPPHAAAEATPGSDRRDAPEGGAPDGTAVAGDAGGTSAELQQAMAYLCHVLVPAAGDASWMAQQQEPDAWARLHAAAGPRPQRSR